MTLSSTYTPAQASCNGSTTVFPFTFPVTAASDVDVFLTDSSGNTTSPTSGFTVTVNGTSGGSVTWAVAPASGYTHTIMRVLPLTQNTSIRNQSVFLPNVIEDEFDRLVMQDQQQQEQLGRVPMLPPGVTTAILPPPSNGSTLGWVAGAWAWVAGAVSNLQTLLAADSGAGLVGYLAPYAGAVATTQHQMNSEHISVFRWFSAAQIADVTAGTATLDVTAAIQTAINTVHAINLGTVYGPFGVQPIGAVTLFFPRGIYKLTSATLETYSNVTLEGEGIRSTILRSTYDGAILRNALPDASYDHLGIGIKKIMLQGDRTKTGQIGLALMRTMMARLEDVSVQECGSNGIHLYQCALSLFSGVESQRNVGYGIVLDQGYTDWTGATPTNLPSINNLITDSHFAYNDKAGIRLQGYHDSNIFRAVSSEQNMQQTAHVGYQIEIVGVSVWPDEFVDHSVESTNGFAHVYVSLSTSGTIVRFTRFHHSGVAGATIDRCANVVQGRLIMDNPYGSATAYRSLGGFITPFQITKSTGSIRLHEPIGSTITNGVWVNDETNAVTALDGQVFLTSAEYAYGPTTRRNVVGGASQDFLTEGSAYPWASFQPYYKQIRLGDGTATPTGILPAQVGSVITAASTISPNCGIHHVSGTTQIVTIALPFAGFTGSIVLIPNAAFTTGTGFGIALASTAVIGKALIMTFDGTNWYPSY